VKDSAPHWARPEDGERALAHIDGALQEMRVAYAKAIDRAVIAIWLDVPGRANALHDVHELREQAAVLKLVRERIEQMLATIRGRDEGH